MLLKDKCTSIEMDNGKELCLLMYADGIVFVAETENDLQLMSNVVSE